MHHSSSMRPRLKDCLVSVVLPVFNESEVLPTLAAQLHAALTDCEVRYEIVFVNDGSSDGSTEALDRLALESSRIRVVHLSRNFGHQAAVQAGLSHTNGDAVILMDSDLQDSPSAIAPFLEAWQSGADVVYAIRTDRKENVLKRCLFAGFHRLLAGVATTRIPADAGNFGLIDRRVVRDIVALGERDRYLPGLRSWVGYRQEGIEVERAARYDEHPRVSLRGLVRLAKTAIFSFSNFPLTVFSWIGYSALILFVSLAGYSLFCKLFTELAVPGWTSHLLSASFFGALNALGISILGEYVIRIYDQVRGRPLYLVDRVTNVGHAPSTAANVRPRDMNDQAYDDLMAQTTALLDMAARERATLDETTSIHPSVDRTMMPRLLQMPGVD